MLETTLRRQISPSHPPLWCTPGEIWSTGFRIEGCCAHIPSNQEFRGRWRCLPGGCCLSWGGHTPEDKVKRVSLQKGQEFDQFKIHMRDLPPLILCQEGTDPSSDPGKPNQMFSPQSPPSFWGSSHQMLLQLTGPRKKKHTVLWPLRTHCCCSVCEETLPFPLILTKQWPDEQWQQSLG